MIKVFLAVASNRVIIDAMTNQLSIIDIYEGLKAQAFPIILPSISILFYLHRDSADPAVMKYSLKCSVGDTETLRVPVDVNFQQGNTTRAIVAFDGFVIPKAGTLKAELFDDEKVIGLLELPVEQLDIPSPHIRTTPPSPSQA